ncbi:hypothetical protein [Streptomyces misionensis]|uniref:hypothetical protein n=1 Tax=Streptomyces misionensis TaxID=67331 RepID=UPI0033C453E3
MRVVGVVVGGTLVVWLGGVRRMLFTAGVRLVVGAVSGLFLSRARVPRVSASAVGGGSIVRWTLRGDAVLVAGPGVLKLIMVRCLSAVCLAVAGGLLIACGAHCGFSPRQTGVVLAAVSVGMLIGAVVVGRVFVPAVRERLVLPLPLPLPLLVMGIPCSCSPWPRPVRWSLPPVWSPAPAPSVCSVCSGASWKVFPRNSRARASRC